MSAKIIQELTIQNHSSKVCILKKNTLKQNERLIICIKKTMFYNKAFSKLIFLNKEAFFILMKRNPYLKIK